MFRLRLQKIQCCNLCELLLSCWKRKPLIHMAPSVAATEAPMICHGSRGAQREFTCRRTSSRYSSSISLYTSKALCSHETVKRHRRGGTCQQHTLQLRKSHICTHLCYLFIHLPSSLHFYPHTANTFSGKEAEGLFLAQQMQIKLCAHWMAISKPLPPPKVSQHIQV